MSRKQRLQFNVERSLGPCAALASNGTQFAYTIGAGVVVEDGQKPQIRVYAPKLEARKPALNLELNEPKPAPAKLRINSISCTAISRKSWVATGETGHAPRVAVWSPASTRPQIVQIHEFGVHKVAFSPSGDLLATLGTSNDGFLYIWCLRSGKPVQVASNRCISDVNALEWVSDTVLVTAGVRHLRVWTYSGEQVLGGRNILLGDDAASKFTSVLPWKDGFLAATTTGTVFYVVDNQIEKVHDAGYEVHSLVPWGTGYACAGFNALATVCNENITELKVVSQAMCMGPKGPVYLHEAAVYELDTNTQIAGGAFIGLFGEFIWTREQAFRQKDLLKVDAESIVARSSGITDVRQLNGQLVIAHQDGTVTVGEESFQAHPEDGAEVRLDTCQEMALSYGRDNCLQLFKGAKQFQSVVLLGRASKAAFVDKATIVVASNKTISILIVDEEGYFHTFKTVPQSSPVQSILADSDRFIVSTLDKKLTFYDLKGGVTSVWAPSDVVGEPLVLTNLAFAEHGGRKYILASGNDKSIVLLDDNETIACQWAHCEPIKTVTMYNNLVVSIGEDGIFTYSIDELVPEETTPVRSRSVSPTRVVRSPSPTRRLRATPSTSSLSKPLFDRPASPTRPARPASPVRARSPVKQPVLEPPLKLKQPVDLHAALGDFVAGPSAAADAETFKLLCKALDKYQDKQAMRYFSQRLAKHFDA